MAFGVSDAIAAGLKIVDKFVPDPAEKIKAEAALRRTDTTRVHTPVQPSGQAPPPPPAASARYSRR